jgi:thiamine pyrophosphate-dependent acetolactate synthase large subunit-like protein
LIRKNSLFCSILLGILINIQVLLVAGDGGFLLNVADMATIQKLVKLEAKDDLPIKVVVLVWNDSSLGIVQWAQTEQVSE